MEPEFSKEKLTRLFTQGYCQEFAQILHDRTGWPTAAILEILPDPDFPDEPNEVPIHWFCIPTRTFNPEGLGVDCLGARLIKDILDDCHPENYPEPIRAQLQEIDPADLQDEALELAKTTMLTLLPNLKSPINAGPPYLFPFKECPLDNELKEAAHNGDITQVKSLLRQGADIGFHDHAPLRLAQTQGHQEIIQILLQNYETSDLVSNQHDEELQGIYQTEIRRRLNRKAAQHAKNLEPIIHP